MKLYEIYKRKNQISNWQLAKVTASFIIKELIIRRLRKQGYFVEVDYSKDRIHQCTTTYNPILE